MWTPGLLGKAYTAFCYARETPQPPETPAKGPELRSPFELKMQPKTEAEYVRKSGSWDVLLMCNSTKRGAGFIGGHSGVMWSAVMGCP